MRGGDAARRRVYPRRPCSGSPAAVLLLAAPCSSPPAAATTTTAAARPTATADRGGRAGGCEKVAAPEPKGEGKLPKPKAKLDAGKTYVATVATNCGDFEITLDAKRAPKTGGVVRSLADKGFFDGTTFHRIVAGFVIQGGDPKGNGTGGPGYSVVEAPPKDLAYTRGVVAMAKTGTEPAGTSGSQFFVVTGRGRRSCRPTTRCSARSRTGRTSSTRSAPSRPTPRPSAGRPGRHRVDQGRRRS